MKSVALYVLLVVAVACGASARHKTIVTTYAATEAAASALVSYSHDHEENIAKTATTLEVGKAELSAFRSKVDHAEKAIAGAYRAEAAAALADDDLSLATMVKIFGIVTTELRELGVVK